MLVHFHLVMASSLYVLILAGGSGERFWPLSRKTKPKQLLALFSEQTLLGQTLQRLEGLVPPQNILILTNSDQEKEVRATCGRLPPENIVAEPAKRDTAAAVALATGWVALRDPDATMIVLPADHLIQDEAGFHRTLRTAAAAAEKTGDLVTIGLQPTWACPGFGYIELGKKLDFDPGAPAVHEVLRFREKPAPELAESFLKQGNFRWNAGMFIWTLPSILDAFDKYTPELSEFIGQIRQSPDMGKILAERFPKLPKISVDYAIMERAARVLVVEAAFDWDDVGSWTAVAKYLRQDEGGNASNMALTQIDAANNIVFSSRKTNISLLGAKNLIIVQTDDALLVCDREEAEKIKALVGKVPEELR